MIDIDDAIIDISSYLNHITIGVWRVRRMGYMDKDWIDVEEKLMDTYYETIERYESGTTNA